MRPFEIIILIIDVVLVLLLLLSSRLRYLVLATSAAAVSAMLIHCIAEGCRWQMIPAYVLTAGLLTAVLIQERSSSEKKRPAWRTAVFALLGVLVLLLAAALPVLLPVPKISAPSGPYAVGTATYHLVDESREEVFGDDPGGAREIMLQVWYPADPGSSTNHAPYFDQLDVAASVLAERLNLPSFFLGHLDLVKTHAQIDAALAGSDHTYPLLLFSHGLRGMRMQNTVQLEELASHGYIIASVDHTYDSVITVMPDDRVILHHGPSVMPDGISAVQSGRKLLDVRVQDLASALKFLEVENQDSDSLLFDRIGLEEIGVMGHSTGGGTAIEFCAQFPQCQAVLVLDGWLGPLSEEASSQPLSQPSLFINTPEWLGDENRSIGEQFISHQDQDSYQATIEEMDHNNFTDIPLLTPIASQIGLAGPIDGPRGIQILEDYSLAFFDRYLRKSTSSDLEKIADRYWEVSFESH